MFSADKMNRQEDVNILLWQNLNLELLKIKTRIYSEFNRLTKEETLLVSLFGSLESDTRY